MIHITKNEFKIFSKLFIVGFQKSKSSVSGFSSGHAAIRSVNEKRLDSGVFSEYNFKNKRVGKKLHLEDNQKPLSAKDGCSVEGQVEGLASYQSGPLTKLPLRIPQASSSHKKPPVTFADQATNTEEVAAQLQVQVLTFQQTLALAGERQGSPGHLKIDLKDICRRESPREETEQDDHEDQEIELRNIYDDENDLSVDSNDPKYILEDDLEESSYRAVDVDNGELLQPSCRKPKASAQKSKARLDLENLKLKFDYDQDVRISDETDIQVPIPSPEISDSKKLKGNYIQKSFVEMIKKISLKSEEPKLQSSQVRADHVKSFQESTPNLLRGQSE